MLVRRKGTCGPRSGRTLPRLFPVGCRWTGMRQSAVPWLAQGRRIRVGCPTGRGLFLSSVQTLVNTHCWLTNMNLMLSAATVFWMGVVSSCSMTRCGWLCHPIFWFHSHHSSSSNIGTHDYPYEWEWGVSSGGCPDVTCGQSGTGNFHARCGSYPQDTFGFVEECRTWRSLFGPLCDCAFKRHLPVPT